LLALGGLSLCLPIFAGCAGTVDTLTSQRFRDSPFRTMFYSDDPMYVLRNVQEADDRVAAMRAIKEPTKAHRPAAEQDELIQILATAATSDKQPICRFSAIETLARFDDPRAAAILVTAYRNVGNEAPAEPRDPTASGVVQASRKTRTPFAPVSTFTADQVGNIQSAALVALGEKKTPEALTLLCEVASAPAKTEIKASEIDVLVGGGTVHDQFDLRQAAIRALANFKGNLTAARTLYKIMTTERDVAPKNRAHLSLVAVTGRDLPPDSTQWLAVLQIKNNELPVKKDVPPKESPDRLNGVIAP
jgi:HEAT repeat protein